MSFIHIVHAAEGAQRAEVVGPIGIFNQFFTAGNFFSETSSILHTIWSTYTIFAYLFSFFLVYIFMYATIRTSHLQAELKNGIEAQRNAFLQTQQIHNPVQKNWQDLFSLVDSTNPNDWKTAIMEADIILDKTLQSLGVGGTTLGERLKSMSPQSFRSLQEAWDAHKVRNEIAHSGADFVLTQRTAKETMFRYQQVLTELGAI